jgi:DNA-binding NarL/FixJ family response regulator
LLEGHSGWQVCATAANGLEAVELTAKLAPDLVILDLSMPRMNGLQAAKAIHTAAPKLPLLLVSMFTMDGQAQAELRAAGFQGFVLKSNASELIHEAIELLLAGKTFFDAGMFGTASISPGGTADSASGEVVPPASEMKTSAGEKTPTES